MIAGFNYIEQRYGAVAAHDGTGIGNVVNDLIDERPHKLLMVGRTRTELLVEYITAAERGAPAPREHPGVRGAVGHLGGGGVRGRTSTVGGRGGADGRGG